MTSEPKKVDLCCGSRKPEGFIGIDSIKLPGVDIVHDLNKGLPFENNSVDFIRAHDALEHLVDKIKIMDEIWRVCKDGALIDIQVPSTDGRGAFQDPTHVSYWNINSFYYYCSDFPEYLSLCRRYGFKGEFKINSIYNVSAFDGVVQVHAMLTAKKPK